MDKVCRAIVLALFVLLGFQVVTWLAVRDELLAIAPLAMMRASQKTGEAFPCTVISKDLAEVVGTEAVKLWAAQALQLGMQLGTEEQLKDEQPSIQFNQCSRLDVAVDWNTPLVARVEIRQWHPAFDSNGFQGYFVPTMGKWFLIGTRQVWS